MGGHANESIPFWESLPSDQMAVLSAHFLSMPLAAVFSRFCDIKSVGDEGRQLISAFIGVSMVIWSYGLASLHIFTHWLLSYVILISLPHPYMARATFWVAVGHILTLNMYNYVFHYGQFPLDITNTLMVTTMKVTSLAYSIEDGTKPAERLTANERKYAVQFAPSLSEHLSYYFCFFGVLFGPFIFYKDYRTFMGMETKNQSSKGMAEALPKLFWGLFFGLVHQLGQPSYAVSVNVDADVLALGFFRRQWILFISMSVARFKYYFAWLTAEAVCLLGGLGIDGPDEANGQTSVVACVRPFKIEMATSLKSFIDNWNIFTAKWLHFICYERMPQYKALSTFVLSASWHGFYPGYYLMFLPLVFYRELGRQIRQSIRPFFQSTQTHKIIYALITWLGTAVTVYFNGTAFQLLTLEKIYAVQSRLYFWPHIVAISLFLFLSSGGLKRTSAVVTLRSPQHTE